MLSLFHFSWLESKRDDDNAEDLWRVHDALYDLTKFVNLHPGGSDWLNFTKVKSIKSLYFLVLKSYF